MDKESEGLILEPTMNLRQVQVPWTTTEPPRLQQAFRDQHGREYWMDIPLVIEPAKD